VRDKSRGFLRGGVKKPGFDFSKARLFKPPSPPPLDKVAKLFPFNGKKFVEC